jgi:hydroxymethylglutaryl-CoA lyase
MSDARRLPQICDVGPRDGLQNAGRVLPAETRIALIDRLSASGVDRIECCSFVNPKRVPQMAEAAAVLRGIRRAKGVRYTALVLNLKGAELALAETLDELRFALGASETFNRRNQGASPAESVAAFAGIVRLAGPAGLPVSATIATSFGCPFEGEVSPMRVRDIAVQLAEAGASEIILADTIGVGVPAKVEALLALVRPAIAGVNGKIELGCHFHDTRRTGLANADAAIRFGVDVLDAAVGGFGGCPFAPGATGNISTEDLAYVLQRSGLPTRLKLDPLLEAARFIGDALGETPPGAIAKVGTFPYRAAVKAD